MSHFPGRGTKSEVETGLVFTPKFDSDGLIPAVVQDFRDGRVLMVAYMNEESLRLTLQTQEAVFFSRSRQELWHKGQSSGNIQQVMEILVDCDQDCLIVKVNQIGDAACHTGQRSCFYRTVQSDGTLQDLGEPPVFDPNQVYK